MEKQINGTKNYFISKDGFCYKTLGFKKQIIKIEIINGIPKVKIKNNKMNFVLLMIEYFVELESEIYKTSYKINDGKISLNDINITYLKSNNSDDEKKIFMYKCREKANDNNKRVCFTHKITSIDVLNCLKRNNFKCFYCNDNIKTKTWHLEHVVPISKGGLNSFDNIAPSCKICNLMKGSLFKEDFINKCYKIVNNEFKNKGFKITINKI